MSELISDNTFLGLVWATFTVSGVIIGWFLRAYLPENDIRKVLERTEQERNTLARLYTHLKHQHDLREADFKRTTLELANFRQYATALEAQINANATSPEQLRRAEEKAIRFAEQVKALEILSQQLQQRNHALELDLARTKEEIEAWQTLYRDFQTLQHRLAIYEQNAKTLEAERNNLMDKLSAARIEVENLQLELMQQQPTTNPVHSRKSAAQSDRKGGPAAPEQTDDLKLINGIAPFAEQQLFALNIHTFLQISRWDDDSVIAFAKALNISPSRIFKEDWVGQAKHLSSSQLR